MESNDRCSNEKRKRIGSFGQRFPMEMDDITSKREEGEDKDISRYELQGNSLGNSLPFDFMGHPRGTNFNPVFYAHEMDNVTIERRGGQKRDLDSFGIQGHSLNFSGQDPSQIPRGTNFNPPISAQEMDNASAKRKGKEKMNMDSYGIQENSLDFTGQNIPYDPQGTNFSHVVFTHKDCVRENLEHRKEFEPPLSPEESYGNVFDFESENQSEKIPMLPRLAGTTVLNLPWEMHGEFACPRPHYVTLGHLHIDTSYPHAVGIAETGRFGDKFVTQVLYKPSSK